MKTLILSPHVDDELIGCYSVLMEFLQSGNEDSLDVVWLYETTDVRLQEGHRLAEHFGFTGATVFNEQVPSLLEREKYDRIYIPARQDWHVDHRVTNQLFRHYATHFYSVDMVRGVPLPEKDSLYKKKLLDTFYPSQARKWTNNARYYAFDAVSDTDIYHYTKKRFGHFSITFPSQYQKDVVAIVNQNFEAFQKCQAKAFNELVTVCVTGDLTFEHVNGTIYKV